MEDMTAENLREELSTLVHTLAFGGGKSRKLQHRHYLEYNADGSSSTLISGTRHINSRSIHQLQILCLNIMFENILREKKILHLLQLTRNSKRLIQTLIIHNDSGSAKAWTGLSMI